MNEKMPTAHHLDRPCDASMIASSSYRPLWQLRELSGLPSRLRGGHIVLGNFDGVHRGHIQVVRRACKLADTDNRPVIAITFDPHPRAFRAPNDNFFQITEPPEKARLLAEAGVDEVICLKLDDDMVVLEPDAFIHQVLARCFEAKSITVGTNFSLGPNRENVVTQFAEGGPSAGMIVNVIPPVTLAEGEKIVSAAAVRSLLAAGNVEMANELLGRRWTVEGTVAHGDKRGRTLGFPTANLHLGRNTRLGFGIYAVRVLMNGKIADGVASFGTRPQFDNGKPRLEIHILDFSGDIYGMPLNVEFVAFQRPECAFSNVGALIEQMDVDCQDARRLLHGGLGKPTPESVFDRRARMLI